MAITRTTYELLKSLPVSRGASLLEIGEANWYGDLDPQAAGLADRESLFDVAKEFYGQWFAPRKCVAVDVNGSEAALRHDLNHPFDLGEQFDVVINHGTAEHVFNVAQVFATMHDHCEIDGWLIHDAPLLGWLDHGFYCLQPTLFYDVALANCYEVYLVAVHETKSETIMRVNGRDDIARILAGSGVPYNSMLFVALRKRVNAPFRIPMQGYYARALSEAGNLAWRDAR